MSTTELDKAARDGLDKAAREASGFLGLNVVVHKPQDAISADCTRYTVELLTTTKPVKSMGIRPFLGELQAFTYLEGLVDGARVERERHRPLVEAASRLCALLPSAGHGNWALGMPAPEAGDCSAATTTLTEALAELEA